MVFAHRGTRRATWNAFSALPPRIAHHFPQSMWVGHLQWWCDEDDDDDGWGWWWWLYNAAVATHATTWLRTALDAWMFMLMLVKRRWRCSKGPTNLRNCRDVWNESNPVGKHFKFRNRGGGIAQHTILQSTAFSGYFWFTFNPSMELNCHSDWHTWAHFTF